MKRYLLYAITLLSAALLSPSCAKEEAAREPGTQNGTLAFTISASRGEGDPEAYDPFDHLTVRIYNSEGGLIRKYTSRETLPARLELLAGDYRIAVEAGDKSKASFTNRTYKGEKQFTIAAKQLSTVDVACRLVNAVAEVRFDESVLTNFGSDFYAWVMAAEAFDESLAEAGAVPALKYTTDAKGYFLLPEGVTSFAWMFRGVHPVKGTIEKTNIVENVQNGGKYILTLKFSPDLPGFIDLALTVDTSVDEEDDTIIFSPDPTISGDGFDMEQPIKYLSGERTFMIATMATMQRVSLNIDSESYDLLAEETLPAGIRVVREGNNLEATLSDAFFAERMGGDHTLMFHITDIDGGALTAETVFRLQGILPVTAQDYNLWNNSVIVRAVAFDPTISEVNFSLRKANGEWQQMAGAAQGEDLYTATFATEWASSLNDANLTIYTPVEGTGVFAAQNYEYNVAFNQTDIHQSSFSTPSGDTIYNSGMEEWSTYKVTGSSVTGGNVAYPNANSSTVFWVGSNNGATSSLCTGQQIAGNNGTRCAQLHPQIATGNNFAAGSLFTGTIDFGTGLLDMFGFARFGIQYKFSARPKALRVHYKAVITKVTHTGKSHLTTNDNDPARIFVAITDWTSRHAVKSGVSFDANTFWDPVKSTSLSEGAILGYGSKMITTSTDGWVTEELPIVWYNTQAAPGAGRYSLSISSATSAFGDYMGGSQNNYLYIEDFEWVY